MIEKAAIIVNEHTDHNRLAGDRLRAGWANGSVISQSVLEYLNLPHNGDDWESNPDRGGKIWLLPWRDLSQNSFKHHAPSWPRI